MGAVNPQFGANGNAALSSFAVNSGTTGWCFAPNLLASLELAHQQSTSPYPTANAGSACPAFGIGNIDTSDHTLSTAGFTTYVDGSYTSLLPGGRNDSRS